MTKTTYLGPPSLSILRWAEADRPREKLILKGKSSLSDVELLAILVGSGTRSLSAVGLAQHLLHENEGDLNQLAKLNVNELQKYKGIGQAKAVTIVSAFELGRRRQGQQEISKPKISSSVDVFNLMKPNLLDLQVEHFWLVLLNRANDVIAMKQISQGGVSGTVVDPKIIFKAAIDVMASGIILVHNHPSGNLKPSEADIQITGQLKAGGKLLEIAVLDHLIFTDKNYYSFADDGRI